MSDYLTKDSVQPLIIIIISIIIFFLCMNSFNPIGMFIAIPGFAFYFNGIYTMKNAWRIHIKRPDKLVNKGVFKGIRHPLYLGVLVGCYGLAVAFNSLLFGIYITIILLPYFYLRARDEEEFLTKEFKEYKSYKEKTGMFLPKIKV